MYINSRKKNKTCCNNANYFHDQIVKKRIDTTKLMREVMNEQFSKIVPIKNVLTTGKQNKYT